MPTRARHGGCAALLIVALLAAGCGDDDDTSASDETQTNSTAGSEQPATIDQSEFTTKIDHPLVPFEAVPYTVFRGKDQGASTRVVNRLTKKTKVVAGVRVAVVSVKEYEDGELVEATEDYYAQRRDGSVWYFGELVNNYENGKVNHEGQWLAGKGNAKPGVFMPAKPKVGQVFEQERAPGVAEDRSTVLKLGVTVRTPAGRFRNCMKVKDFAPIDKVTEFKWYCPGVGFARETEKGARSALVEYRRAK